MRLRLGGRGYAPSVDNQLGLHVKGLGEFVDMLHKLQTIVEEEVNCSWVNALDNQFSAMCV